MKTSHALMSGAVTGFLLAWALCLLLEIAFIDSLYRIFVLTVAGAWMGVLLAWLDQLLHPSDDRMEQENGHQDLSR